MKKTILNLLLAIVAVAGFTACSSSDDYQRATVSGEQVFFPNTLPSTQNISFDKSSFTIAVGRQISVHNNIAAAVLHEPRGEAQQAAVRTHTSPF